MPKMNKTAADRLQDAGFAPMNKPTGKPPVMPTATADLSGKDLGNLMSNYSAWREFAEDLHIRAVFEFTVADEAYRNKYNEVLSTISAKTATEAKAQAAVDTRVMALRSAMVEAEMYMKMIGGKLESITNSINTISREFTRRGTFTDRGV